MTLTRLALASSVLLCVAAQAQTTGSETKRNADQQQRIENGLKSGQLSTREAANIEHQEQRVNRTESRDLRDGTLSAADKAQIQREQNHVSNDIYRQKHDAQAGNHASRSSQRMQADVQRDVNQQSRINHGVRSGALTHHETAALEHGQARVEGRQAAAGANGRIGAGGQARIEHADNGQSGRIYRKRHNGRGRSGT